MLIFEFDLIKCIQVFKYINHITKLNFNVLKFKSLNFTKIYQNNC